MAVSLFNSFAHFSPGTENKTFIKTKKIDLDTPGDFVESKKFHITYEYSLKQRSGHLSCGFIDCIPLALAIIAYRKGWLGQLAPQEGLKRTIVAISGVVTLGLVAFDIRTWINRPTEIEQMDL